MPSLPSKITAEYYVPALADTKRRLLYRYTIAGFRSLDEALRRAKERVALDGKKVVSANFRAGPGGEIEAVVVYVEERA